MEEPGQRRISRRSDRLAAWFVEHEQGVTDVNAGQAVVTYWRMGALQLPGPKAPSKIAVFTGVFLDLSPRSD
jgi:hypothetical protein